MMDFTPDIRTRAILYRELLDVWVATGRTMVFITHDITEAVKLGDVVVVVSGSPGEVLTRVSIGLDWPRVRPAANSTASSGDSRLNSALTLS